MGNASVLQIILEKRKNKKKTTVTTFMEVHFFFLHSKLNFVAG